MELNELVPNRIVSGLTASREKNIAISMSIRV